MTRKLVPTIIAVLLMLAACSKQEGEEYYPKASKGAQWEYSLEYMTPFAGVQKGKLLVRVDGEETIKGKTYSKNVTVFSGIPGAESVISYYRRGPEGIYKIDGKHKDSPEYLETPFPVTIGKSWTVQEPDGQTQYKAEAIETVEMFDRKCENCLKISLKGKNSSGNFEGYSYHAPGIGEVKGVIKQSGVTLEYVLAKYKL